MFDSQDDIKPKNLELHDFLIRKTAVKLMIDETIVDKVISNEKKSINKAFKTYSEVEISGFGKFFISQVKTRKKLVTLNNILTALQKKHVATPLGEEVNPDIIIKIEFTHKEIAHYESKLKSDEDRFKGNIGGSKEQPLSRKGN